MRPGWFDAPAATALTASDGVELALGAAKDIYAFELLRPAAVDGYRIEMETVGDWLGVGLPGGQFVLLDRCAGQPRVYRQDICWAGDAKDPATTASWPIVSLGPWFVVYQHDRWRAAHLLSGRDGDDLPPVASWRAPDDVVIASPPVILPRTAERPETGRWASDALLVWLAGSPDGELKLYTAALSATTEEDPQVGSIPVGKLGLSGSNVSAIVAAIPGAPPYVLLASGTAVVLLAIRAPGKVERPLAATTDLPPLAVGATDRGPGSLTAIGFLPHPSADGSALGIAAMGCNEGDLLIVPIEKNKVGVGRHVIRDGGRLLGTARLAGEDVFLTFDGRGLKAVNRLQDSRQVRNLSGVYKIQWGRVTGRLFVCAGTQTNGNFFTDVIDLESGLSLGVVADPRREPPRPAVLGRNVFTVAMRTVNGRDQGLSLLRRPVTFTELPLALDDDTVSAVPATNPAPTANPIPVATAIPAAPPGPPRPPRPVPQATPVPKPRSPRPPIDL